ncbi:MAG: acyl-ACP--UDP-N-acetylglucosamine O-acyltransferase [Phycisphaerales bacterium]|nr:MAG: acyl-ACP--UDP-N-acetylglucosamine O-acyltransferase [Phycisphaerales bacterium]
MAIHPTAIIDPKAELDSSVEVGPYCVIDGHVRVAPGCRLYHGVYLTGWTEIGENCELHPGVVVGHRPQDTKYGGERSYCRIGRRTILREHVTIHRGTTPDSETVVGEDCFLLAGSHVGHNGLVGNRVTLVNNVLLGGHVEIGDDATLGGSAVVHQFVRVGELAMIAGNARVTRDVLPFALINVEGRVAGLNRVGMRRAGLPREQVNEIRDAYRVLFAHGLRLPEATAQLARELRSPPGKRLVQFLEGRSARGVAGRSRAKAKSWESAREQH